MASGSFGPSYDSAGSPYYNIQVNWDDNSGQDIDTDVSTVTATAYLSATNGGFDGFTCTWSLKINETTVASDTQKLWGWTGSSQRQFATGSLSVPHNADGTKDIIIKAYFDDTDNTKSYTPKDVTISRTVTLTDLVRPPKAPANGPTLVRNAVSGTAGVGDGTRISVTSQAAASYTVPTTATTRYDYRRSSNGGSTWTTVTGSTSPVSASFPDFTGADPTLVYLFQSRAINAEGTGAWSDSSTAYAVPTITSATKSGTSVTVAVAPPANLGDATITSYTVQYSLDQTTWTGAQTLTGASGGNIVFTNLPAGKTYYFRAYYTTSAPVVNSPYQYKLSGGAVASVFVSAYGKRYQTKSITGVTAVGSTTTYTCVGHGFSVNDPVTVTEITPSTLNASGTVTAVGSANNFTLGSTTPATTSGTWSSGGTAAGWASILTGKRVDIISGPITGVVINTPVSGDITYTASNSFSAGDSVSIGGVSPSAFNLTGATIKSATSTSFVITNGATGTFSASTTGYAGRLANITSSQKYTAGAWTSFN